MEERKLSIGQLAAYAHLPYDTVYSLVKGRRVNTSSRTLAPVAKALGVTVDYLVGKSDERARVAPDLDPLTGELLDAARSLSRRRKRDLIRLARALDDAADRRAHAAIEELREMVLDVFEELNLQEQAEYLARWLDDLEGNTGNTPPGTDNGTKGGLLGDDTPGESGDEDSDVE